MINTINIVRNGYKIYSSNYKIDIKCPVEMTHLSCYKRTRIIIVEQIKVKKQ